MALSALHGTTEFSVGDIVRVHQRIQEGEKTRIQVFEGMLIALRGEKGNKSFVVRRIGNGGIGIERIFPLFSPIIEKVEVKAKGFVRRSKLYYLRTKSAREVAEVTKKRGQQVQISTKKRASAKQKMKKRTKKAASKKTSAKKSK